MLSIYIICNIYIERENIIIVLPCDHGGPTLCFKFESSPTILRGAVDSAVLCRSPVCFVVIDIYLDVVIVVTQEYRHLGKYQLLCSNLLSAIPHYVVINNLILYIYIYISDMSSVAKYPSIEDYSILPIDVFGSSYTFCSKQSFDVSRINQVSAVFNKNRFLIFILAPA